jgi:hypothetical protein
MKERCIAPDKGIAMKTTNHATGSALVVAAALLAAPQPGRAGTDAYGTFIDQTIVNGVIASLVVPPGAYVVSAKLNLENRVNGPRTVRCQLSANADFDDNTVQLMGHGSSNADSAIVSHQLLTRIPDQPNSHSIFLHCSPNSGAKTSDVIVKFAKITAQRVDGEFSNSPS